MSLTSARLVVNTPAAAQYSLIGARLEGSISLKRSISRREVLGSLARRHGRFAFEGRATAQVAGLTIAGRPVELALTSVSPDTIRLSLVPIENKLIVDDGVLSEAARRLTPPAPFSTSAPPGIPLGNLIVKVEREPLSLTVSDKAARLIQKLRIDQQTGAIFFNLGDRPVLGFGEGGPQFDRRGSKDEMRNGQGGYRLRTHGGRAPIPWLIGTSGWAMFIHQPLGKFDLTGAEGRLDPLSPAASLPMDLFIVNGDDPVRVMAEYARLTGKPGCPRFGPSVICNRIAPIRTGRSRWVARSFREKKLPCDALIYLGTDFTPSGWNTHNGEFTWNRANFPDPKKIVDELHAQHFKVVLHTVLEGRRLTGTVNDPCTAAPLPSGRTPDGRWPDDRQVSCYWPVHKQLYDAGIDGWWPDQVTALTHRGWRAIVCTTPRQLGQRTPFSRIATASRMPLRLVPLVG